MASISMRSGQGLEVRRPGAWSGSAIHTASKSAAVNCPYWASTCWAAPGASRDTFLRRPPNSCTTAVTAASSAAEADDPTGAGEQAATEKAIIIISQGFIGFLLKELRRHH